MVSLPSLKFEPIPTMLFHDSWDILAGTHSDIWLIMLADDFVEQSPKAHN